VCISGLDELAQQQGGELCCSLLMLAVTCVS
jgi:hypothetical protein